MILYSPPCPFVVITPDKYEFCSGDTVTIYADSFYTNYTYYQWFLNDVPINKEIGPVLVANYIVSGDLIYCRITGSTCDSRKSNEIKFTVYQPNTPTITINWTKYGSILEVNQTLCSGDTAIFSSVYTYGGSHPTFQWYHNHGIGWSAIAGQTSQTMLHVPISGETIACVMGSKASCVSPTGATSNVLAMDVRDKLPVSVSLTNSPSGTICPGTSVTYTATGVNKGLSPTYKWYVNGTLMESSTHSTYTYTPNNGDLITVTMTSSLECKSGSPATDTISQNVESTVTPTITLYSNPMYDPEGGGLYLASVVSGTTISFYAYGTNGCTSPTYSWKLVRGVNTTTISTNQSFTYYPAQGDKIYCIYTSNCQCTTVNPVTSITVTISLYDPLVRSITISSSPFPAAICSGDTITFTAHPTNYTNPQYQWHIDTTHVGTNSSTYSTNSIANGSVVSCVCTESGGLNSNTSNTITVTVVQRVTPSVTISRVPTGTVCSGELITFYIGSSSNLGSSPTYQWWWYDGSDWRQLRGATNYFYQSTSWENGNSIRLIVSNINTTCSTSTTVTSNTITVTIQSNVTPSITIQSNMACIPTDNNLIFTSFVTYGGVLPTYEWYYSSNGSNYTLGQGGTTTSWNTGIRFSGYTNLFVYCNLTSTETCHSPDTVSSNIIVLSTCTGCTQNVQLVENGDGWGKTDWINPTNGLAEKWIKVSRLTLPPYTPDYTNIITTVIGNNSDGFTDNYQRATFDYNTPNTCCVISTDGYTFNVTEGQQDYVLRFKYRCGYWDGTFGTMTYSGIYPSLGVYIKQSNGAQILKVGALPNISNAIQTGVTFSHNNSVSSGTNIVSLWFGHSVLGSLGTIRIELDEVNLWECPSGISP